LGAHKPESEKAKRKDGNSDIPPAPGPALCVPRAASPAPSPATTTGPTATAATKTAVAGVAFSSGVVAVQQHPYGKHSSNSNRPPAALPVAAGFVY
jgi:hypothetical protein